MRVVLECLWIMTGYEDVLGLGADTVNLVYGFDSLCVCGDDFS